MRAIMAETRPCVNATKTGARRPRPNDFAGSSNYGGGASSLSRETSSTYSTERLSYTAFPS